MTFSQLKYGIHKGKLLLLTQNEIIKKTINLLTQNRYNKEKIMKLNKFIKSIKWLKIHNRRISTSEKQPFSVIISKSSPLSSEFKIRIILLPTVLTYESTNPI